MEKINLESYSVEHLKKLKVSKLIREVSESYREVIGSNLDHFANLVSARILEADSEDLTEKIDIALRGIVIEGVEIRAAKPELYAKIDELKEKIRIEIDNAFPDGLEQ